MPLYERLKCKSVRNRNLELTLTFVLLKLTSRTWQLTNISADRCSEIFSPFIGGASLRHLFLYINTCRSFYRSA
jgi:hypothetical protein